MSTTTEIPPETAEATTAAEAHRPLIEIRPPEIFDRLREGVLGQDKALRHVSVAVYKHTLGRISGNLLMIGNSGTGKTTIMNNLQRLYHEIPEYRPFRAVTIINANLLVDPDRMEFRPERLLTAVEQRARAICSERPTPDELAEAIGRATICIDEIDKMSAIIAGKPNPLGVVLQQGLLTMMEGERLAFRTHAWVEGKEKEVTLDIDTGRMMFICGGAFEGLYDQVFNRVTKPGSGEKLKSRTIRTAEGQVKIETVFGLVDFLKPTDLFDFGMVPQFLARFSNTVLLEDLSIQVLKEILLHSHESPFVRARRYFEMFDIHLEMEDLAASLIAESAHKDSRTGARALRPIFGELINPFEFDAWSRHDEMESRDDGGYDLTVTADMVRLVTK